MLKVISLLRGCKTRRDHWQDRYLKQHLEDFPAICRMKYGVEFDLASVEKNRLVVQYHLEEVDSETPLEQVIEAFPN